MGQRRGQIMAPAIVQGAQYTAQLAQRLAPLGFALGGDEIGQSLHRGKVELTVMEGAAGKLAGLGRAQAG